MENENNSIFSNSDLEAEFIDCSFEVVELPSDAQPQTGTYAAKKIRASQKSYRKKVESVWSHEDILRLIEEVEVRRSLWDAGCADYKLPKGLLWQEIADRLSVTLNDCKGKWANLRTSFNCNLDKLRKKKSGQGSGDNIQIAWRYFKPMLFLEAMKVRQTTQSISSMELESATRDESLINDFGFSDDLASNSPCNSGKTRSRKTTSTKSASCGGNAEIKEMALEALHSLRSSDSQPKDTCAAFGDYIAAELRNLPTEIASVARAKFRRSLNDILDEVALMVPQHQQ